MKRKDVKCHVTLDKYCDQGLNVEHKEEFKLLFPGGTLGGLTRQTPINLKKGFTAVLVHTMQAQKYWLLYCFGNLVNIQTGDKEGLKQLKQSVYVVRRSTFNNKNRTFLKSAHEREIEKREDMKHNSKMLERRARND